MLTPITRSSEGQLLDNPARADPGEGQERAPGENPLGVSGRENIPRRGNRLQKGLKRGRQAQGTSKELRATHVDRHMQSKGEHGVR